MSIQNNKSLLQNWSIKKKIIKKIILLTFSCVRIAKKNRVNSSLKQIIILNNKNNTNVDDFYSIRMIFDC